VAAVDFTPLKPLFLQCYQSAHVSVPANPSLPPLTFNVRRNPETTELREVLPAIAFSLYDIKDQELAEANRFFSRGKFPESLGAFRTILQKLLLVVAKDDSEATDVSLSIFAEGM
jgi:coatomer protein complex subunit alpha (xenin)